MLFIRHDFFHTCWPVISVLQQRGRPSSFARSSQSRELHASNYSVDPNTRTQNNNFSIFTNQLMGVSNGVIGEGITKTRQEKNAGD
jgi:hypothetical protein